MKKSNRLLSMFLCLAILITSLVGFTSISYAATRSFTSGDLSCTLDTDTGVFTVKAPAEVRAMPTVQQKEHHGIQPTAARLKVLLSKAVL